MLGLDPNWGKLPPSLTEGLSLQLGAVETRQAKADIYEKFCCDMTDVCAEFICGVKPQLGYFEALGSVGIKALENVLAYVRQNHPELIILMDAKRGDIGSTSEAYAQAFLGEGSPLAGDAVTVAPYMGRDSLEPFSTLAKASGKGVFVLAKTSNPTSADIQDHKLFPVIGSTVAEHWAQLTELEAVDQGLAVDSFKHLGLVVGATHPQDLVKFGKIAPDCWILAPGVGAQGGKISNVMKVRPEKTKLEDKGVIIPVSRSVLYASDGEDYLAAAKAVMKDLWEGQKIILSF